MEQVSFEVLGPLRVVDQSGADLAPVGRLQRRLLAALVLALGRPVSSDHLAEVLWPDARPARPAAQLHTHVFRLRQRISGLRVEHRPDGYVLDVDDDVVDAVRFERAVFEAAACRRDDPAGAVQLLDGALASWRGTPYGDLDEVDGARIEAERLRELRCRALEERFAALLQMGAAASALADLEAFVAEEPLRERPRELLMDALAAAGRRADGLRVYDAYRRVLAQELGVDPSAHLRARHAALLDDDEVAPASSADRRPAIPVPRPLSSFVGRDDLVRTLEQQVPRHRMVTLVGPGGVGKTRLVVELLHRVVDRFPDGVAFCDLTAAAEAEVAAAVASAVGAEARSGVEPSDRVAEVLRHDRALLVLDNCEHVLDGVAGFVEALLGATDHLVVVATSRERLAVEGERLFPVDPLGVGDEHSPAVELFADRAAAASPTFDPNGDARPRVVELCRQLDGLPLAIELAASRLRSLTIDEIIEGLEQSTSVLRGGRRTVPRHRSLDAALTWSHRLLTDHDRDVLAAAATFVGPFDADDVAAVADQEPTEVRDRLSDLVERSLVHRHDGGFRLLQVVRRFVNERTAEVGDPARLARRHACRVVERVEHASARLRTAHDDQPIRDVRGLVGDLRQAMVAALAEDDADLAIRIVLAVRDPGMAGMLPELMAWGEPAGELGARAGHPLSGDAFTIAALAAWKAGDMGGMRRLLERADAANAAAGQPDRYEQLGALGTEALAHGRLDEAVDLLRRSVLCPEAEGDPVRLAEGRATLAIAAAYAHRPDACDEADRLLTEVVPGAGALPAAWCWYAAGECRLDSDPVGARERLQRAVELARACSATFVEGIAGASLASVDARRAGAREAAIDSYRWLLPLWLRAGVRSPFRTMLRTVAQLLCEAGADEAAARLLGAVTAPDAGPEVVGDDVARMAAVEAALEARLGRARLDELLGEGRRFDDAAAAAEATAAFEVIS